MGSYNTSMEMTNPDDFGITIIELIWTIYKRSDRSNSPLNLFYSARSIGSGCVSMEDYSLEGFELLVMYIKRGILVMGRSVLSNLYIVLLLL